MINATQAKRLFKICAVVLGVLTVAALAGLIYTLPGSQRKDGLVGVTLALVVLTAGFYAIYRVARVMEREDTKIEERQHHDSH